MVEIHYGLCIPRLLNVTAWMAGCLYDVVAVSMSAGVGIVIRFVLAGCWVTVVVCLRLKNRSSVGWHSCVVSRVGVLCGIVHGAGNDILMRGGACAAELRLMGFGVGSFYVSGCVFVLLSFCVLRLLLLVGGII